MKIILGSYPDLLGVRHIAEIFRTDVKQVNRHVRNGRFGNVLRSLGGQYKVPRAQVAAVLRECGYTVVGDGDETGASADA